MGVDLEQRLALFLSELLETNATLDFYCDFDKIKQNVRNIEINLNTLNYLLGKQNLRQAVEELWNRDAKVFEVMQILIAVRPEQNKRVTNNQKQVVPITDYLTSVDGIMEYLESSGLATIFKDKSIKNLILLIMSLV